MKVSHLIKQLQKDYDRYGDFDIGISVTDNDLIELECTTDDNWDIGYLFIEDENIGWIYGDILNENR